MMMKLSKLQEKAIQRYNGGEFADLTNMEEVADCGDTLLLFLLREAHDASDEDEFLSMVASASAQLDEFQASMKAPNSHPRPRNT